MTHILCIETGTDTCSVALAADSENAGTPPRLIAIRETHGERDHAARVAVYTEEVLAETGLRPEDLAAVAVSRGPGSYTGLRIGVSFAKGVCYGLNIPLIGVGSLDSLCAEARRNHLVNNTVNNTVNNPGNNPGDLFIPMIDARRMEVFGQVFDANGTALTAPEAWIIEPGSLDEWRNRARARESESKRNEVFIFGSGAGKCRQTLPWAHHIDVQPSARGMVRLAFEAFESGTLENTAYFEPFYLKDFVITTSKKKLF